MNSCLKLPNCTEREKIEEEKAGYWLQKSLQTEVWYFRNILFTWNTWKMESLILKISWSETTNKYMYIFCKLSLLFLSY